MRTLRFYCETFRDNHAILDASQSRHLSRVLRLTIGDPVQIFDGKGLLAQASVERIDPEQVTLRLLSTATIPPKTSGRIILAVSMAKGERFEWMIEKCTELGADHIAAVQYERTVKMGKNSALERCRKIALAAAKQSGRLHLPVLSGPTSLDKTLSELRTHYPDAQLVYGDADGKPLEPFDSTRTRPDIIVCIGPEGGFSDAERLFFDAASARPVCLNPNILRIETAAIAFSAVLSLNG